MSELADTLAQLKAYGLLGRATAINVGAVSVVMLPGVEEAKESDHMREMRAEQEHQDTLFGSS